MVSSVWGDSYKGQHRPAQEEAKVASYCSNEVLKIIRYIVYYFDSIFISMHNMLCKGVSESKLGNVHSIYILLY